MTQAQREELKAFAEKSLRGEWSSYSPLSILELLAEHERMRELLVEARVALDHFAEGDSLTLSQIEDFLEGR